MQEVGFVMGKVKEVERRRCDHKQVKRENDNGIMATGDTGQVPIGLVLRNHKFESTSCL